MSRLFFKYYLDVTKYNAIFCILMCIISPDLIEIIILFGTVGVLISFLAYRYFQDIEYYFYINCGLSKRNLQLKTFIINLAVSSIILITIWGIRYR
jgi:hypothetical protein